MTTVKVDTYKDSGKWYTNYEFKTEIPTYDNNALQEEIERRYMTTLDMSYVYEATMPVENGEAMSRRLVIR